MANKYWIPTTWRNMIVTGTMEDGNSAIPVEYQLLYMEFSQNSTDATSADALMPSYDGAHAGLAGPYSYGVLGAKGTTPILAPKKYYIRAEGVTDYLRIESRISGEYTRDILVFLNDDTSSIVGISFRADNFNAACGIYLAKFADDVYIIGGISNTGFTEPLPSYFTLVMPTSSNFGIAGVTFAASGTYVDHTMLVSYNARIGNTNCQRAGNVLAAVAKEIQTDPYAGAGASGPGGGDGTFDFSSTPIDYPGLPTIGAYSTGFLNVYVPSAANLRSLAAYMWSGAFDIDNFRKLVADPMDAIMGLSIVPVTSTEIGVESTTLIVGNISTGISMPRALSQYVSVDCGEIEMPAKWGAYLDFSPYTKLQLYLPYIGFVDISPDDIMTANMGEDDDKMYPGTIGVQYHVDILSGSCIAFVKCRDHVIYEFGGQCACSCPVTEGQYKNGLLGMLEIISTVASTASAVAGGPGEGASKANQRASKIGKVGAVAEGALGVIDTSLAMIKPNITRSGSVGGSNGLMGYQIPYLVLTVPHMCIPGDQNVYIGYPSFVTLEMSELAGFTQIQITHLHNMSCTSDEADEIISLLSEGVIF